WASCRRLLQIRVPAGSAAVLAERHERWPLGPAFFRSTRTTRRESTARREIPRWWNRAGNLVKLGAVTGRRAGTHRRNGAEQPARIGMKRAGEERLGG